MEESQIYHIDGMYGGKLTRSLVVEKHEGHVILRGFESNYELRKEKSSAVIKLNTNIVTELLDEYSDNLLRGYTYFDSMKDGVENNSFNVRALPDKDEFYISILNIEGDGRIKNMFMGHFEWDKIVGLIEFLGGN